MIDDGLLERVKPDLSMSLHVLPMINTGQAVVQRGPLWASRDELLLTVGCPMHANVWVPPHDRARLEHLCRYLLRPPLVQDRVRRRADGRVAVKFKGAWRDGTTHLIFEPLEFLGEAGRTDAPSTRSTCSSTTACSRHMRRWRPRSWAIVGWRPRPPLMTPPRPAGAPRLASCHARLTRLLDIARAVRAPSVQSMARTRFIRRAPGGRREWSTTEKKALCRLPPSTTCSRRPAVELDSMGIGRFLTGKRVLVTDAAGSIGAEISRQVLVFDPNTEVCLDHDENALFDLEVLPSGAGRGRTSVYRLGDITDGEFMDSVLREVKPEVVFHAAACGGRPGEAGHARAALRHRPRVPRGAAAREVERDSTAGDGQRVR